MGELITLQHIDLAVHFDWKRSILITDTPSPTYDLLFEQQHIQRCRERLVRTIAKSPETAVFYFSSFLKNDTGRLEKYSIVTNQPAYLQDIVRILEYQKLLGKRFFLMADHSEPDKEQLTSLLQSRGFTFDADDTTLSAYGEYLEWCVLAKQRVIQDALGLNPANCHLLAALSKT